MEVEGIQVKVSFNTESEKLDIKDFLIKNMEMMRTADCCLVEILHLL